MGEIKLKSFNSYNDFINDTLAKESNLNITLKDMISYAISAGGFSNWNVSSCGEKFYSSLVKMAVTDGEQFTIRDDYRYSEQSIKTSISFFMGMIAAKAVADKQYNIPYLFHLKDSQLFFTSKGKTPDFFGLINGKEPILIEAKGTTANKPSNSVVEKAKNQLISIRSIEIDGWKKRYTRFKKHVISSCFENNKLTYIDVDPDKNGETELKINIDKAIILYYRDIMNLLLTNNVDTFKFQSSSYLITNIGNYKIGLNETVYNILTEYKDIFFVEPEKKIDFTTFNLEDTYTRISNIVFDIPKTFPLSTEVSLRTDGIICL